MKKNLLSILILALLIVNIVLTSIMMFSVTSASKQTTALVTDIASVLQLELSGGDEAEAAEVIPMSQTEVYNFEDPLTIALKNGEDGTTHYALVSVALSKNIKAKGYKEYGSAESMLSYQPLITSEITEVFGSYTLDELRDGGKQDEAKKEILTRIQKMFESEFIYNVSFSDIKFQ